MNNDLTSTDLSWFANEFMLDFAKVCIAIENFSNEPYDCFYTGFWGYFKSFLEQRTSYDIEATLNNSYAYFYNLIKDYIPFDSSDNILMSLKNIPDSGKECVEQLNNLRKLEER